VPRNYDSLPNTHGNLVCAIDIETTGSDVEKHEIIQVAIVPLDIDFTPLKSLRPFVSYVRPERPEDADPEATCVHGIEIPTLCHAPSGERVIDRITEWVNDLELAYDRRLIMLAHNASFEHRFLVRFLGNDLYYNIFNANTRDSQVLALGINDLAVARGRKPPFERCSMGWLGKHFGIVNAHHHDAYHDAVACAALYRELLKTDVVL